MKQEDSTTNWLTPRSVTWAGIITDATLTAGKIIAGVICASQAIFADGLHSGSDLITDIAVLTGLGVAQKPADGEHRYGHHRATTLVAMFIGAVLLGAGGWIAYRAIVNLHQPSHSLRAGPPFWIALAAIPIKEFLYQITRRVGRRTSDLSLLGNAWHHRTDALTSIAAAVGLGGVLLGGPGWQMLDAVTGLVLAAFLAVIAMRIVLSSASELM
ncbi:MAG: cation diffusion facilitator family transporter, partial [Planctomycetota bacterium]